jgi:FkbH-like protein
MTALHLCACSEVASGARALGRPLVHNEGRIDIGRALLRSLGSPVRLTATSTGAISIADDATIDAGATLYSESSVRVEQAAVIGPGALICDRDEQGRSGPLVIEREARIGAGARVLGAVRVGRGAVVTAGCTVTSDVLPGTVLEREGRGDGGAGHERGTDNVSGHADPAEAKPASAASPDTGRHLRAVLLADFTVDELVEPLAAPDHDDLHLVAEVAPFDQVIPTLMTLAASNEAKPDVAVVWTRPERVSPAFADVLVGREPELAQILAEVDAFVSALKAHAAAARFLFVPSWVLPPHRRGLGPLELRGGHAAHALLRMNLRLIEALGETPSVYVLDASRWLAMARDGGFEAKMWFAGKVAFSGDVLVEASRDIRAAVRAVLGLSRKLVVVDLDDTLWGGVVGDVGWESLRLGGHDPSGEAFVAFQEQLVALTRRGVALAVVSKNEESTALEAMRRHPEMRIRPEMLATYRVNWQDKARNVVEIAEELNLGLQSVVFLDDSPIERARVREALPEVYVPDWPDDPAQFPAALESLRCFDAAHLTAEDLERNAMYATERARTTARSQVASFDDWLLTLELRVRFEPLGPDNLARAAQLMNKTNQMNLRTRRMSEAELAAWARGEGHEVWTVHVSDRLGTAGLTGIVSVARHGDEVHLEDYVLSCRVMGRRVEETMLWAAKERARALGGRALVALPLPTAKNKPCLDFFERCGLARVADGYVARLDAPSDAPRLLSVEGLA